MGRDRSYGAHREIREVPDWGGEHKRKERALGKGRAGVGGGGGDRPSNGSMVVAKKKKGRRRGIPR